MKLTIHPEGLAVLGALGIILLWIALFVLRDPLFDLLFTKAVQAMDDPSDSKHGQSRKRIKFDRERWHKQKIAFYFLSGLIVAWILADWLWLPATLSPGGEWRWPLATTALFAGVVIIFIGGKQWDARIGWSKWTFWYALLASALSLLLFAYWTHTDRPRPLAGACILGGILFLWLFGMLRRIDRNNLPAGSSVEPSVSQKETEFHRNHHKKR